MHTRSTSRDRADRDRGVSEVIGYVLTLALILSSVALVLGIGFPQMEELKSAQQDENAEGAFVRVATKFQQLGARGAPYRAGQLSVAPGQLLVADGSTLNVTVALPSGNRTRTFDLRTLRYQRGGTTVAMEGGAIFRSDDGQPVTVARSPLRCDDESAVVTVTTLVPTGPSSVTSDLVTVSGRHRNTSLWHPTNRTGADSADTATAVTVATDSEFDAAWTRSLRRTPGWRETGDAFVCTTERVYVRHVRIGVEFV